MKALNYAGFIVAISLALASCQSKEKEALRLEIDSLQRSLVEHHKAMKALENIGILMDSIDIQQQQIRLELGNTQTIEAYPERMAAIKNYVSDSQMKIRNLEKSLNNSEALKNQFGASVRKLKNELEAKNKVLDELQIRIAHLEEDNRSLHMTVSQQQSSLTQNAISLDQKRTQVSQMELQIDQLSSESRQQKAESFFANGMMLEEMASRTQMAPKKRKAALKEAMINYQKAYDLGKSDARPKIEELNKRLKA